MLLGQTTGLRKNLAVWTRALCCVVVGVVSSSFTPSPRDRHTVRVLKRKRRSQPNERCAVHRLDPSSHPPPAYACMHPRCVDGEFGRQRRIWISGPGAFREPMCSAFMTDDDAATAPERTTAGLALLQQQQQQPCALDFEPGPKTRASPRRTENARFPLPTRQKQSAGCSLSLCTQARGTWNKVTQRCPTFIRLHMPNRAASALQSGTRASICLACRNEIGRT